MKPVPMYRSPSLSPWISPTFGTPCAAGPRQSSDSRCILLVDDRPAFRHAVTTDLQHHGFQVLPASGAYDAWRLARHRHVDLIVIRGDLHSQSGWQCAAKLCGRPPWQGVIMHFDSLGDIDRTWRRAAGVAGLVETGGRAESVVECVLHTCSHALGNGTFHEPHRLSTAIRT